MSTPVVYYELRFSATLKCESLSRRGTLNITSSSPTPTKPSAADLELTLAQVRGVCAACVVLDQNRDVNEIHIVASATRKPKQIVRDVETLLFVKHRVKVDYRKISMVLLPDEKLLKIPLARPEILRIVEDNLGSEKRIRVEIRGASKVAIGEAREEIDNPMTFQTSAKATINAIEKLLSQHLDVRLDDVAALRLGMREVVLVVLTSLLENREETFVGASFVATRPAESAARATLDALNRRIYNLTTQAPRQTDQDD